MHLTRIAILGFKSFSEKTEITFDRGITCVVGPNGCGKSNIADAIRWALGERSAKMLRSSRMEDVIFNGTERRKPFGFAEVSLTLDNADKTLPIDYSEVVITRRILRSGESEYFINHNLVRNKDVQDLILNTGLGSNSYSMVEQGKIDYILNATPDERRQLIEEAAGISKYHVKREEAVRKLERTESNLLRLKDIIYEVEKNINYAERQANRATRYKEKVELLKELELSKATIEITDKVKQQIDVKNNLSKLEDSLREQKRQLDLTLLHLEDSERQLSNFEGSLMTFFESREKIQIRLSQKKEEYRFNQEKEVELKSMNARLSLEKSKLSNTIELKNDELRLKQNSLKELIRDQTSLKELLDQKKQVVQTLRSELGDLEKEIIQLRKTTIEKAYKIRTEDHIKKSQSNVQLELLKLDEVKSKKTGIAENLMALGNKVTALESECAGFQKRFGQVNAEHEAQKNKINDITRERWHCISKHKSLTMEFEKSDSDLKDIMKINNLISDPIDETNAKILVEGEMVSPALKQILDNSTIEDGYANIVSIYARRWLKALLISNANDAASQLEKIKNLEFKSTKNLLVLLHLDFFRHKRFRMTEMTLPQDTIKGSEIIKTKKEFEEIKNLIFDSLLIVANQERYNWNDYIKLALEGFTIASLSGWIIEPDGRIIVLRPEDIKLKLIDFKETDRLSEKRDSLWSELNENWTRIVEFVTDIEVEQRKLENLELCQLDSVRKLDKAQASIDELKNRIAMENDKLTSCDREITFLEMHVSPFREGSLTDNDKSFSDDDLVLLKQLEEKERGHDELKGQMEAMENDFREKEKVAVTLLEKVAYGRNLIEDLKDLIAEKEQKLNEISTSINEDEVRIRWFIMENEKIQSLLQKSEIELTTFEGRLNSLSGKKAALESEREQLRKISSEYSERIRSIESETHNLRIRQMQLDYEIDTIKKYLEQTYQIKANEVMDGMQHVSIREELTIDECEKRVSVLKKEMESFGAVNILAIDELCELKERHNFLKQQEIDLSQARTELNEAIRKINRTTKQLFEETFENVEINFIYYFRLLFGGGDAKLLLLEVSNSQEAGVDIMARPPGKKAQQIQLLSGGEKALTAVALLFALFKVKPSPFCVLDEIDAPLDEANVDRFIMILREFVSDTQFIVITHNRKTISSAHALYGITMEEAGVSKIISVKLSEFGLQNDISGLRNQGEINVDYLFNPRIQCQ